MQWYLLNSHAEEDIMSDIDYTYAVARIRALELSLFSEAVLEQMMGLKTYDDCIRFLKEKGWGEDDSSMDAETILSQERDSIWRTVRDLKVDMEVFDVLSYPTLFHNLKAAIKEVCTQEVTSNIFYQDCPVSSEEMLRIVQEKDFGALPEYMRESAGEAYEAMLQSRDGQLCDVILDAAALAAIRQTGEASPVEIIRQYAESTVAVANIKIAVRASKTGKSLEFMKRAMAKCRSLDIETLMKAALKGQDAICDYLTVTEFAEGAGALKRSPSEFERWCDNRIIQTIRPQKYNTFSAGPLFAYILARENEIKSVRIILTGKLNDLPEESIRERIREMYV